MTDRTNPRRGGRPGPGERSAAEDSFSRGAELDHPHFTRPRVFRGQEVPEVLLSGDHARIARWRAEQASRRTAARGPARAGPDNTKDPRNQDTTIAPPTGDGPRGRTAIPGGGAPGSGEQ